MLDLRNLKVCGAAEKTSARISARRPARFLECVLLAALLLTLKPAVSLAANRDVEVAGVESARFGGRAGFTGVVKINREKPIEGLVLTLEFLDAQGVLLTIQKQSIDDRLLAAGDEVPFDLEGRDVPRAVSFRIVMHDSKKRGLSVAGEGPHPF